MSDINVVKVAGYGLIIGTTTFIGMKIGELAVERIPVFYRKCKKEVSDFRENRKSKKEKEMNSVVTTENPTPTEENAQ